MAEQGEAVLGGGPVGVRPRSASFALGSVTAVAVVVVAVLVAGMRLTGGGPPAPPAVGFEDEVPAALAGGVPFGPVPPEVASAVDLPVLAAIITDAPPDGVPLDCDMGTVDHGAPETVRTVVLTPDLADVLAVGPPLEGAEEMWGEAFPDGTLMMEQCRWLEQRGGGWSNDGGMSGIATDLGGGDGGLSMSCCDERGLATASTSLRAPDGALWALQERGAYWLAYPVGELPSVPISWRYSQGPFGNGRGTTHVLWLDADGTVVDEQYVSA